MDFTALAEIVKTFGPWVALTVFFVWTNHLREGNLSSRLSTVEDYTRTTLQTVIADNTRAMNSLASILEDRPCIASDRKRIQEVAK